MLTILIGRAKTGKSDTMLRRMAELGESSQQILLVPEHASHQAEVDVCSACGDTASRHAEVLSFRRLSERVLSITGGIADVTLDNGGKLLTLQRALLETAPQMTVYQKPSQKVGFLEQMLALFDELRSYEVTPEILYQQAQDIDGATHDKLTDLSLLYAAYEARLRRPGLDARDRMTKLCDHLEESGYVRGKDIFIDGFTYFNAQERRALAIFLRQARSVTVTLLGEVNSREEIFEPTLKTMSMLERLAASEGKPVKLLSLTNEDPSALGHLERHFFGENLPYEGDSTVIRLREAATVYSEVEQTAADIRRLLAAGKCRCRDITVAARNMTEYAGTIETVFERYGIPVYLSRRSDILEKPVLTMLLSAVDAVTGGFEYEDVFRCLKTGMAGVSMAECDILENYVIRWEIRGAMWLRDTDWTASPDGYGAELNDTRRQRLAEVNTVRRRVRELFADLSEGLKTGLTIRDKAETLYRFAESAAVPETLKQQTEALYDDGQVQLAEEYSQLWRIFCDVLDQFVELLGDVEVDGQEFARLLRLVLSQYAVATIPATLDQVKVTPLTRNDRHTVRHLFLLGANDNVLPTVEQGGGILDAQERALLQQRGILLSDATFDPLSAELQNIYACLAQPTASLTVTWPVSDGMGSQLLPSFVVARITRLFPQVTIEREDGSYRRELPAAALALAGQEPGGPLWQYFAEHGQKPLLTRMEQARAMGRGKLSRQAVETLYGRRIAMSASRVDRLKSCHFGYFMEYGLRAKERTSAGFEAPEVGTFIHYLLENVNRDVRDRGGYGRVDKLALRKLVHHYVDEYARTQIDGYAGKSARFRYLFSRLRETACAIVENIADEMAVSDFQPMAFELGFGGKDGQLPAITVTEGATTLSVGGKVDRVDGWLKDGKLYLRVVDYKTGKKAFDLTDVRYGLGIQMLLYLFTLQREGSSYFGSPVEPAGVLYMPARDIILQADRALPPDKIEDMLRRELRRTGMLLGEPEVLTAMEHSALESPCYLPVGVTKDGAMQGLASSVLVSTAQMGKMARYIDSLLHRVAREIGEGNIDADPCTRGPQDSACAWCAFQSACWFDESRDKPHYLRKTTPEEFWQVVDEEVKQHG